MEKWVKGKGKSMEELVAIQGDKVGVSTVAEVQFIQKGWSRTRGLKVEG